MKLVIYGFVGLVVILALSWIFTGNDFFLYKYFAPRQEVVRRQVFEQTPSYVEGKVSYIAQLRMDYENASTSDRKASFKRMILSEASTVNNSLLPEDTRRFIGDLKAGAK